MNKTIKRNVVVSAILAIMLCVSLITGATFALFTSESNVNIAVSSGKVSVVASIDETSVSTKKLYDTQYTQGALNMYEGVATFNDEGLTLTNFVPGDGIKFNIVVENESNVTVQYRTIISCENDNGLFAGLNISIDEENYNSARVVSNWEALTVGSADAIVPVTIELPEDASNIYQEKSCTISYKVEAIQGNANVVSVNGEGQTTVDKEVEDANGNKAKVFVGTAIKNGEIGLTLNVEDLDESNDTNVQTGYFELQDGNTAYAFEVKIPEIDETNETPVVVTMEVPKNLTGVVLFHSGVAMTFVASEQEVNEHHEFYYDAVNGKITFATKNFSNFTLVSGLENVAFVGTADELVAALENGIAKEIVFKNNIKIDPAKMSNAYGTTGVNVKNNQTLNGNGYILDVKGAGGTWDSGINITGGTIKNITVTGSFRGIFINHNSTVCGKVYLENVTTTGTTYTISCDQGTNSGLEATDCKFYGWTSFAATLGDAKFTNCIFGEGSGYNYSRPYAPTSYVNCTFEEGHGLDPRAEVVFYECNLNGVELTEENVADLVTESTLGNVDFGVVVNSGDEIQDAINNGEGNIILGGDIDLSNGGLVFP